MAYWTIIGTGFEGDTRGEAFAVTLNTDEDNWIASGASVNMFFLTKSGRYAHAALPEIGTQLVKASAAEVAFFHNLIATSPVGAGGTGRASEKGVTFTWKLDSK